MTALLALAAHLSAQAIHRGDRERAREALRGAAIRPIRGIHAETALTLAAFALPLLALWAAGALS